MAAVAEAGCNVVSGICWGGLMSVYYGGAAMMSGAARLNLRRAQANLQRKAAAKGRVILNFQWRMGGLPAADTAQIASAFERAGATTIGISGDCISVRCPDDWDYGTLCDLADKEE